MKQLITILIVFLALGPMNAQNHYQFRTNAPQGFSIESSTQTGLSLHYSVPEIGIANIDNGEVKGQEIILKGCFGSFAEGLPNLPFENCYIAVPKGATISIEVIEKGCQTLNGIELLPAAEVQLNTDKGLPKLSKNMDIFGKDANFPSENVSIAQTTQIRGLDVVMLNVTPFRYNPVRKTLEVIYGMDIEVRFEGGNGQFGDARYRNPDWDHILRDLVINSDMLPEAHYYDLLNEAIQNHEEGCEYLIIAPDDDSILACADTLKNFRMKQGILTKVVTTTECGGNELDSIKNYIKNAYENWTIPPAALLIFGAYHDTTHNGQTYFLEGIPGFPLTFYNYESYGSVYNRDYFSDNPYADMNDDSIPDIAISRLPALKLKEYQTQLGKLFNYETNPPKDSHYYDHPVITSSYENNKWFMITSQAVNGYFCDKLGKHPSNFYMPYASGPEPNIPDSVWSTGYNTSAPFDYFGPDGQGYFPRYLFELDNWQYMFENQYLIDALSEGSFLTLYRDHSSTDVWCSPYFYSSEIKKLRNEEPTFLLSIGCHTADYHQQYSHYHEDDFITAYCNAPHGALGGIGAVTVTRSHFNDMLSWGIVDYIWPEFMPTLGSTYNPDFARPSFALVSGKLFLNRHTFMPDWWPGYITDTHNVFHFLGETYFSLCTEVPQPIAMEACPYHPNDQWEYTFTSDAGATVCFSKDNEILTVLQGTEQSQSVTLPQMNVGDRFFLTATMQNHIRFEQEVTIVRADQSFVFLKEATFKDQDADGQLNYGEYSQLDLELCNVGGHASEGAQITLTCDSPYITIVQATESYPRLEPGGTVSLSNVFKFKIANDIPDQTNIRFGLNFNDGGNTHTDCFDCIVNAPCIQIESEFQLWTDNDEPSTHIATEGKSKIVFTVTNKGHSSTTLLSANLEVKAPFVEVENSPLQIESLAPNDTCTYTYELNTLPNSISGAWLQSHLRIQHLNMETDLDTIIQYGAIFENFESDTLNPVFSWSNNSSVPWAYCDDDAFEGQRSFEAYTDNDYYTPTFSNIATGIYQSAHPVKISFYYKMNQDGTMTFNHGAYTSIELLPSDNWTYFEYYLPSRSLRLFWRLYHTGENPAICKIDHICFPPAHRAIAFAGNDMFSCHEAQVELHQAYAYDCDSVRWTTDGDGYFDYDTLVNPVYFPGSQDLAHGNATLTLTAFGNDTMVSKTQIYFVDEISLGAIVGDSIVNKYEHHVSHYSIENQEGLNYLWQLEPVEMGSIYNYGDGIDIAWNLHEGDAEAVLSVTADNGCDVEAITKTISLIGYSTPEWPSVSFDLYPNPTDGKVNIVLSENLQGKAVVEVFNLLGERMLYQKASQLHKGETISLDLSNMVSGLYIIKLRTENGSCSKKVSVR